MAIAVFQELLFWGIEESEIEPCCWAVYSKNTEHRKTLEELDDNFAYQTDMQAWEDSVTGFKKFQLKVWKFLEDPSSSRGAKVISTFYQFGVFYLESRYINLFGVYSEKKCEGEGN